MRVNGSGGSQQAVPLTRGRIALQWLTVLGPPTAVFAHQQLSYFLVDKACRNQASLLLHIPAALALAAVGVMVTLSWREWKESRSRGAPGDDLMMASAGFFALVGLALSGLAVGLIVAQWLPNIFLGPCVR